MKDVQTERVETSFRGRMWSFPQVAREDVDALISEGVDRRLGKILAGRGVLAADLSVYFNPTLRQMMPEPFSFLDMKIGAKRIAEAVRNGERIGIWSDYDADGATSAAVLGRFLRMCGHDMITVRIPDRIKEGYGPNTKGLLEMKESQGCNLVCILDAGIVAFRPLADAHDAGMEIVVIDHHMPAGATPTETDPDWTGPDDLLRQEKRVIPHQLPDMPIPIAHAVINANRRDQAPGHGHLCAAGVTFIFCVAVARELRLSDYFKDGATPDLMSLLDIVALGTVCDVVPLKTLNRAFVKTGLKVMSRRDTAGIRELAQAAGLDPNQPLTEKHCGWQLGPRINAGGRIGNSLLGAHLLLEDDGPMAQQRAVELDILNADRKEIEAACTETALAQLAGREVGADRTLALAIVEGAHEGVVGISAGRVRERYDAPAIVLTNDHDGNLKGSARSVPSFDIGHAIIEASQSGLILKGGGHGMAGGLTLTRAQVPAFTEFMNAQIAMSHYFETGVTTEADLSLDLKDLTVDLILSMEQMRPYGMGNPEPVIVLRNVELAEIRIMKEVHMKITFRDGPSSVDALIWNAVGSPFGDAIEAARGMRVDALGKPEINEYRGVQRTQMMLEDLRWPAAG